MTHQADAQEVRMRNIVDMALGFTGMTRVFSRGSAAAISERLRQVFARLDCIVKREDYERLHADFCDWFAQTIGTAEKKLKNGRIKLRGASSYGQGAKVLDVAAKVYIYYCGQPSLDVARKLVPMLHGAVDTRMMQYLSTYREAGVASKTIEKVDRDEYRKLQSFVARDIEREFQSQIHPVQWDDIVFRRLNRRISTANHRMPLKNQAARDT
jgi:hypothetical protein